MPYQNSGAVDFHPLRILQGAEYQGVRMKPCIVVRFVFV